MPLAKHNSTTTDLIASDNHCLGLDTAYGQDVSQQMHHGVTFALFCPTLREFPQHN